MEQLGIIGAGPGGADLLRTFLDIPRIKIIGIADLDPNSPGMLLAKEHGIYTTTNMQNILAKPGKKIIFDATGSPAVEEVLQKAATETTIIIGTEVALLIWEMVDAKTQINQTLVAESSSLLSFIEDGLGHLDVINTKHGQELQKAVNEIKNLADLTLESQSLINQTADVMKLIRNVADQTRILGINASIESARAGEHGRGFGVVADSIRELSASSIKSVKSVAGTMEAINKTLADIGTSVSQIVTDIGRIEAQQKELTEELHSSLEEMVQSANRLAEIAGQGKTEKK